MPADGRLMPDTDVTVTVIDTESGHHRESKTWILGRFLRDFNYQLNNEMKDEQSHIPSDFKDEPIPTGNGKGRPWAGLQITVFEVADNPSPAHGIPELDWVWYSGFFVILVQLVIAIIPWIIIGQWPVFLVTGAGNILAITSASLPQWGREKWACPKSGGSTVTITEGNGSRSAIVILRKKDVGLKLEVLARGTRVAPASLFTRIATAVLAMLWILLLITVAGMKEKTWCKKIQTPSCIPKSLLSTTIWYLLIRLRPTRHWPPRHKSEYPCQQCLPLARRAWYPY